MTHVELVPGILLIIAKQGFVSNIFCYTRSSVKFGQDCIVKRASLVSSLIIILYV